MTALKLAMRLDAKDAFKYRLVAGDIVMLESVGTAPYPEHELGDELFGCVSSIATRLWQAC